MKVSPAWLQKFFAAPLPNAEAIADALTFHAAEVEEITPTYIDVKVLPDRAAYMLSHRGVALELSAALGTPMSTDPLREPIGEFPSTDALAISIEDPEKCRRYMAALVKGVKVGPSPAWLKEALESVGQRSINNVVDATNYVMLNIGQPLHAFDAKSFTAESGTYTVGVRGARAGETFVTLTGEAYELPEGALLVTDAHTDIPLDIGGIKGGKAAGITEATVDIILEAANFDATTIRRTAQTLKLFTDASSRFQNRPSPALVPYGIRDALALILELAGGELIGVRDEYPAPVEVQPVTTSLAKLNGRLGSSFTLVEVRSVFDRLGFTYSEAEDAFTVLPPFERRDIVITDDLAEEVARILGYDRIPSSDLPGVPSLPEQTKFRGIERIRDFLVERGFIEVSTPSFDASGEIELANPLQQDRPWLRASLLPTLKEALARAVPQAPRTLGTAPLVKVFEVGTAFTADGEYTLVALAVHALAGTGAQEALKENVATIEQELLQNPGKARFALDANAVEILLTDEDLVRLGEGYELAPVAHGAFEAFSIYPFALRDIAVWTPAGTSQEAIESIIRTHAGTLLVRVDLFDTFEKEGRISYAFRLVFESPDKTLSDTELTPVMEKITQALNATAGFQVR
ncbi:MAG: Phenylalanine--tRNA ligase [Parcubacteria group bacterium]|nr:Phenylalanine--tRNA ligase [Parcubacteria group bacterium]